jgi:thioredoxin reductase (NADPH)
LRARCRRISGEGWLANLREQLTPYDVASEHAQVEAIEAVSDGFRVDYRPMQSGDAETARSVHARRVLPAAGIRDGLPLVPNADEPTRYGLFRLCPICDGYETEGRRIAMLGRAKCALSHAIFMRTFLRDVSVVASDLAALSGAEVDSAASGGVSLITLLRLEAPRGADQAVQIIGPGGAIHRFDSVYPVTGCHPRTDVLGLEVERDEDGMVRTDKHQRTSIQHLYAAGDIVSTLNRISVASG